MPSKNCYKNYVSCTYMFTYNSPFACEQKYPYLRVCLLPINTSLGCSSYRRNTLLNDKLLKYFSLDDSQIWRIEQNWKFATLRCIGTIHTLAYIYKWFNDGIFINVPRLMTYNVSKVENKSRLVSTRITIYVPKVVYKLTFA